MSILEILLVITVSAATIAGIALAAYLAVNYRDKLSAETYLLDAQASHVMQTAEVERNTLEATIKAHEKNGANKLRGEIARLGGNISAIETLIGSSLNAISKKDLPESKPCCSGTSRGPDIVFNGQPSPGASVQS